MKVDHQETTDPKLERVKTALDSCRKSLIGDLEGKDRGLQDWQLEFIPVLPKPFDDIGSVLVPSFQIL